MELDVIGGDLALDFANTLGGRREGPWDDEWLHDYADLVAWAALMGRRGHAGLGAWAERAARQEPSAAALPRALALRSAIYDAFSALAADTPPPEPALDAIRAAAADALAHARVTAAARAPALVTWPDGPDAPARHVALAALDLLRSPRLARVKQCAHCRWLYLDASRNRSRRWCSMAHCGNAAKVRRRRARRS